MAKGDTRVPISSLSLKVQKELANQIQDPRQREEIKRYLSDAEKARRRVKKAKRNAQKQARRNNRSKK